MNSYSSLDYTARTVCDCLEEIRTLDRAKNYGPLLSLVEEVQVLFNRMEASMSIKKSLEEWQEERIEAKEERKKLVEEIEKLELTKKAAESNQ